MRRTIIQQPIPRWSRQQDRLVSAFAEVGYWSNPSNGATGRANTPDHASLDATGRLTLIVCCETISNAEADTLVGKGDSFLTYGIIRSNLDPTRLRFLWRSSAANEGLSSAAGIVVATPRWYRFDWEPIGVDANGYFWISDDPPSTDPDVVSWTLFQSFLDTGRSVIDVSAHSGVVGGRNDGVNSLGSPIYYAEIRVDGTRVANPDFRSRRQFTSPTTLTDDSGKVWTFQGTASWVLPKQTALTEANTDYYPHFPTKNRVQRIRGR